MKGSEGKTAKKSKTAEEMLHNKINAITYIDVCNSLVNGFQRIMIAKK